MEWNGSAAAPRRAALAAVIALLGVTVVVLAAVALGAAARDPGPFGAPLDVDPDSVAARAVADPSLDDEERALLGTIAGRATAVWVTGPTRLTRDRVADAVGGAGDRGAIAVLVAYNIPGRDCGSHSASAEGVDAASYREWIEEFVAGLGRQRAIIVVEPDAIAQLDCLDAHEQSSRLALLRYATERFSGQGSYVYLDAGHSAWLEPEVAAARLRSAGVAIARGFALNVSNYRATDDQLAYGEQISDELGGGARIVVDTSRNGIPSDSGEWCNPSGRGLGEAPTVDTGHPLADAFLWVKQPGRSDGTCNGGPPAGEWWTEYALMLARNATG